jgi:hypothetical protein
MKAPRLSTRLALYAERKTGSLSALGKDDDGVVVVVDVDVDDDHHHDDDQ